MCSRFDQRPSRFLILVMSVVLVNMTWAYPGQEYYQAIHSYVLEKLDRYPFIRILN